VYKVVNFTLVTGMGIGCGFRRKEKQSQPSVFHGIVVFFFFTKINVHWSIFLGYHIFALARVNLPQLHTRLRTFGCTRKWRLVEGLCNEAMVWTNPYVRTDGGGSAC
jgi:hypothetical protein